MYTTITRRRLNSARSQETRQRAEREYFPQLRQAAGFIGFYLVADEDQGINVAVTVWQDRQSAEAFRPQVEAWAQVLESMGSQPESMNRGETIVEITPEQ